MAQFNRVAVLRFGKIGRKAWEDKAWPPSPLCFHNMRGGDPGLV